MKFFKKCTFLCLLLSLILLVGCSGQETAARRAFEDMMNAFKERNESLIDDYYSFNAVTNYIEEADGEEYCDTVLETLRKMDYKINSVESAGENSVLINADITTVDFSKIVGDYIDKVAELVASREYQVKVPTMTEGEYKTIMANLMVESISSSGDDMTTKTVEVMMIKSGEDWVLGGDTDVLMNALFADMSNAVESLT